MIIVYDSDKLNKVFQRYLKRKPACRLLSSESSFRWNTADNFSEVCHDKHHI